VGPIPPEDGHPLTARYRSRLVALDDHAVFRTGLDTLLNGIATDAAEGRS
jgi:hypothetical protein